MRVQPTGLRKRMMAGVACPACQHMDCVMMFVSADDEWIECVDCGHQERRPTPSELSAIQAKNAAEDELNAPDMEPKPVRFL